MPSRRHQMLVVIGAAHLALVFCGALGFDFRTFQIPPLRALCWYSAMSGANNRYSFFAPGVETPTRVAFTLRDEEEDRRWTETLEFGKTSEANLRLATVGFALPLLDENDQALMARSLASTMLQRYPAADSIEVRYEAYGVEMDGELGAFPSMRAYRDGKRPSWVTLSSSAPLADPTRKP